MKKLLVVFAILPLFLSGCGILKKGCDCPRFGKVDNPHQTEVHAVVPVEGESMD